MNGYAWIGQKWPEPYRVEKEVPNQTLADSRSWRWGWEKDGGSEEIVPFADRKFLIFFKVSLHLIVGSTFMGKFLKNYCCFLLTGGRGVRI